MSDAWAKCKTCRYYDGNRLCYVEPNGAQRKPYAIACRHHVESVDVRSQYEIDVEVHALLMLLRHAIGAVEAEGVGE